jgi:Big-like domain-containing protein/PKD domain-containing protein
MVTHMKRAFAGLAVLCLVAAMPLMYACDKVPLLAPTGSVISLFAAANTVPINGDIEIVANVIENGTTSTPTTPTTPGNGTPGTGTTGTTSTTSAGAGTPVQNGTLVSFTTTIGRIEPSEARTSNGQVRVRFFAGNQSGTATITAFSGGASGKLENLKVGAAAVERVLLSASPQTLPPSGGTSTITARVEDASGLGLSGVPVTFTTDNGSLNPPTATTDANGVATTSLNAPRTAKVTANVAGKTADVTVGLNPRTGISITAPTTPVAAGLPATFTINVGTTANITNVIVDFGDGTQQSLGAISGSTTISHVYNEAGTFSVRATATDASGFTEQVATSVTILPAQPPAVTITGPQTAKLNETVLFTANVSGATSTILRYEWDFGDGANPRTVITTGNRATTTYTSTGSKVVNVHVVQAIGPAGDGTTVINISATLR